MRKILIFLVLIISINSFGQNPANYQYRVVYERLRGLMPDSVFHLPRYNGVPSGLRGGSSTQDGAIAGDTLNHAVYFYSGSLWNKLLSIRDTLSISTRAWRQKGIDSLVGLLGGGSDQKFGHPSGDFRDAVNNRTFSLAGNGIMQIDSANGYYVGFDPGGDFNFFDYLTSTTRFDMNGLWSKVFSPNGNNYTEASNSMVQLNFNNGANYLNVLSDSILLHKRASYEGNIHSTFKPFSLIDKSYADSIVAAGGVNIYNSDGTLTGDRTVTTSTRGLNIQSSTLSGLSNLLHIDDSTTYIQGQGNGQTNFFRQQSSTIGALDTRIRSSGFDGFDSTNAEIVLSSGGNMTLYSGYQATQKSVLLNSFGMTVSTLAGTGNRLVGSNASGRLLNIVLDGATITNDTLHVTGGVGGSGTVTDVSVVSANGFYGSVATSTTTPAITLNLQRGFETWYQYYVDMSSTGFGGLYNVISGTGSAITNFNSSAIPDGWMYGRSLETGTTTTGLACHYGAASPGSYAAISISSSFRYNYGETVRLEDLSDGTDTYNYYAGFIDDITGGANVVDGIFFNYSHSLSSGQWQCITRSNGTSTTTASGVTVAADTDYKLEVTVYNGEAKFYINGSLVATNSTNIPTGSTRFTTIGNCIIKSAGTTSRKAYVEWIGFGKRSN